jgi:colanic acid/amylovoran biosynthesis glycosyltransferase
MADGADAEAPARPGGLRLAYLCSAYPAPSHTFVLREVQALRRLGVEVVPFTVHRTAPADLLSAVDRAEAEKTSHLLPSSVWRLGREMARLLRAPGGGSGLRAGARQAWKLRRPGMRGLLWQLFYLAEAILLWAECSRRSLHHIHVHFANAASDIALLTAAIGSGQSPGSPWSWSFTMHGPAEFWNVDANRLPEKVMDAAFVVCISDFARSQLVALTSVQSASRLHVVHCGVDSSTYGQEGEQIDGDAETGAPTLICVGRLVPVKGQALLLQAAAELRRHGRDVSVEIIGEGPVRPLLEQLIDEQGLADRVRLVGALGQEEIPARLRAATIFVLPSFAEGVPVVAMEAMAVGTPVVTTRIAGIPELIEDGVSGLLVTPGRLDELVGAIERLLDDDALRGGIVAAARRQVAQHFDSGIEAQKLVSLFSEQVRG